MSASSARVWVLLGSKLGDNAQALRLAEAVGVPFTTRALVVRLEFETAKPAVRPSLHHINCAASEALAPPWPEMVVTIGRRLSIAALWIKQQSQGRTKIVLIGRPKRHSGQFDLIIAPAHYRVPDRPNVFRIGLPLIAVDPPVLAAARESWTSRLEHLAPPSTALLVGGSTGHRRFDPASARRIVAETLRVRDRDGGSLYVSTSRRTPAAAVEAIADALPADVPLYRWRPEDAENPYLGLLALADRFVVTGDSISMLVELARLGKPLAIAPLEKRGPLRRLTRSLAALAGLGPSRDLHALHDYLYRGGWAVPLGEPFRAPPGPPPDDTAIAAERVRSLLS